MEFQSSISELKIDQAIIKSNNSNFFSFLIDTDSIRYAFAKHIVIMDIPFDKQFDKNSNNKLDFSIELIPKNRLFNMMVTLRLYDGGKIGFLDSTMSYETIGGGLTWKNAFCGLTNNWQSWQTNPYLLDSDKIECLIQLGKEIQEFLDNQHKLKIQFLHSAIRRFMSSYEQDYLEDRIIDLCICLESIYQDDIQELRFKLAVRTASFLESDPCLQNRIYRIILDGYKIRSKIVHGDKVPKVTVENLSLSELTDELEDICT